MFINAVTTWWMWLDNRLPKQAKQSEKVSLAEA